MNIEISRNSVKARIVNEQPSERRSEDSTCNNEPDTKHENNNYETDRPKFENSKSGIQLQEQYDDLLEKNELLRRQLSCRDEIVKKQLTEIHRLKTDNKKQIDAKNVIKIDNERLVKDLDAEKWLSEKLKQDVRDLQVQLGFEECYLQEQVHQIGIMETLLKETQKRYLAQCEEITELRKQSNKAKEKLDGQIMYLQEMLNN